MTFENDLEKTLGNNCININHFFFNDKFLLEESAISLGLFWVVRGIFSFGYCDLVNNQLQKCISFLFSKSLFKIAFR